MLSNHPLISLNSFFLKRPILFTWIILFFKPLLRNIWISPQSPIIVIVSGEGVGIPCDEQEDNVYESSVHFVGSPHTH